MRAIKNSTHIEGLLYDHKLQAKITGENSKAPGTPFVTGTISIATDNDITNIVDVHYTYVTPKTSKGLVNNTYVILSDIIAGKYNTVLGAGKDLATKIKCDSAIGINDFYVDRNGEETLVSAKRNEGGFIRVGEPLSEDERTRDTFNCDMIITGLREIEADEERNLPAKIILKGATFDFRKALLPVEFSVINENGMDYFRSLEISNKTPVFTNVTGHQISSTVVKRIEEEGAFGEVRVREVTSNHKDWVITTAIKEPYPWDDESSITVKELTEAMANRDTYLATVKQRRQEYLASQKGNAAPTAEREFKF